MALISSHTETKRPVRPDDFQVQKSSLFDNCAAMLRQAVVETRREQPDKAFNGYNYEIVTDGAGVKHYNLTVYFMDDEPGMPEKPTLNPRNLNGAEQAVFGQTVTPEEIAEKGIGYFDQRRKTI